MVKVLQVRDMESSVQIDGKQPCKNVDDRCIIPAVMGSTCAAAAMASRMVVGTWSLCFSDARLVLAACKTSAAACSIEHHVIVNFQRWWLNGRSI